MEGIDIYIVEIMGEGGGGDGILGAKSWERGGEGR